MGKGDGADGTELPELAFDGVGGGRGEALPVPVPLGPPEVEAKLTLCSPPASLLAALPERDRPPSLFRNFEVLDSPVSDRLRDENDDVDGSPLFVGVVSPDLPFLRSSAILRWCSS